MNNIEISFDDGLRYDLKIAKILDVYGLKATFYIPTNCGLNKQQIRELSQHHNIGGHTLTHPEDMKLLNDEHLWNEVYINKLWLEKILNKKITKFCYPSGRYNDKVVEAVKKAGYINARTTIILNIDKPKDKFRIETTIHIYPHRQEYKGRDWLDIAKEKFLEAKENNGYFNLWGHSEEIICYKQLDKMIELFKFIKDNK